MLEYLQKKKSKSLLSNMDLTKSTSKYSCEYCNKSYVKESTLLAHMCEPKRRWLQKDEKRVQLGMYAFQRFYKLSAGHKKKKHMKILLSHRFTMLLLSLAVLLIMLSLYILTNILTML